MSYQKNARRAKASARAFLEFDDFDTIVDLCNLQATLDWTVWFDEDGNKLKISKNKQIIIYPTKKQASSTKDLFKKSLPSDLYKNSNKLLAIFGKKKDALLFFGKDGLLRVSVFENYTWTKNISPLLLGFKFLTKVLKINNGTSVFEVSQLRVWEKTTGYIYSKIPCEDHKVLKLLEKN